MNFKNTQYLKIEYATVEVCYWCQSFCLNVVNMVSVIAQQPTGKQERHKKYSSAVHSSVNFLQFRETILQFQIFKIQFHFSRKIRVKQKESRTQKAVSPQPLVSQKGSHLKIEIFAQGFSTSEHRAINQHLTCVFFV